jgi:hypothetical protein
LAEALRRIIVSGRERTKKGEHMEELRIGPSRIVKALNMLVEADTDRSNASKAIKEYQATQEKPSPPPVFNNLDAFLAFHSNRERYEAALSQKEAYQATAEESYNKASGVLRKVLPQGTRLAYDYRGDREDLRGTTFTIDNRAGEIVISGSLPPAT